MNKFQYQKYLRSKHWQNVKRIYYAKYSYECVRCGWRKNLQIHHLHYRNIGRERLEDLQALCRRCHMKAHGLLADNKKRNWKLWVVFAFIAWVVSWFLDK